MKEKLLDIEGVKFNYKYSIPRNEQQTILILHGWGGSSDSWGEVGSILSKQGYNVVIPDLPGFGKSELIDIYSLSDYAKIIEKFVNYLGLKDIILLGHSNGGAISIMIENRGKIAISKLILNNSAGIRKKPIISIKRVIFKILSYPFKLIKFIPGMDKLRILFYKLIGSYDYILAEKNMKLHETLKIMLNSDLKESIKKIQADTLIIWGDIDTYTPVLDGYKMNKWIKKSELIVLKKQKHGIHIHNPSLLSQTIITNLS